MRFMNTGGMHTETTPDGPKRFKKGEIVETPRNLSEIFPGKFQLVSADGALMINPPQIPDASAVSVEPQSAIWGEDVTDAFEGVEELGVKVYKKEGWYSAIKNEQSLTKRKMRIDELRVLLDSLKESEEQPA